ncbi:hypothetical protein L249_2868 [Ophiocordyceps polyrhachis-furcata BCC 54312]|uniref:Uncharacterized protein n=1 Tax=Ophiocordyceps polyrhachis-furcata BCC 54312 TaxID=1330021 RepID=A0A367LPP6_9HYPO|nr:hypothetical protein L249_2868 [Ophiocordyceps polyrhachis-furcata BCC 54312]
MAWFYLHVLAIALGLCGFALHQRRNASKRQSSHHQAPRTKANVEADHRLAPDPSSTMLFSRFTVGQVGDFPDYASLSGVRLPSPVADFAIEKAVPRPYRPFRWPYHQTMALQKLDPDYWLELESSYRDRILQREALYAKHGRHIVDALPGSELAQKELMEMVIQFLCARYPQQFELRGPTFVNRLLGREQHLGEVVEPLRVLLSNVPEDFAIVLPDERTGRYSFRAGIICSAVGWHLNQKMGLSLAEIHEPVPHYKEKIAFSVDRFFSKLATSNPIQRASWGLEIGQPLFLPSTDAEFGRRETQDPCLAAEDVYLRVDWQTLRRLPVSGALVFNFKALFTPVAEFRDEPYVPSLLLKILDDGDREMMKYKGTWHVQHVVKPALEAYERFQVEQGLMDEHWAPETLKESPFFPGWESKYLHACE